MDILLQIVLLIIGFVLLIKGADIFVDGASKIAKRLGVPMLVIGLTIVAMGTSLPEAAVSISAALKGSADIAVGNVVGSNILNVLLILGISAVITPLAVQKCTVKYEIPITFAVIIIFALLGLNDGVIGIWGGIILWVLFLGYMGYLFWISKTGQVQEEPAPEDDKKENVFKLILCIIVGIALIILGSNISVEAAKKIASAFGMSERLIGLTIVALGTSLPELVTSVIAAIRKNADIAIGNIIGSNIFNILFVIGTSALITPVVYQSAFIFDTVVCVFSTILLFVLVLNKKRKLNRIGGIIMLLAFAAYLAYLIPTSMV
ncbi:MAG: calcium/sodium antiporter [Clostridia bacterium]|nr:calcium/sodium antiporter [Clostridia bacterium]